MAERHVLVVDDEELIRWSLSEHLQALGYRVSEAGDGAAALESMQADRPDLVLLDLKMPEMGGMEVLAAMQERGIDVPVIVVTAYGGLDSAVAATKRGARAYLSKPFDLDAVSAAVDDTLEEERRRRELFRAEHAPRGGYGRFIGSSPVLEPVFDTLRRLEKVDAPTVLITGESGTGKDVIARSLHERGRRSDRTFVDIDCAALPETLIESELFGHEKGAFTDARDRKRGLFEVAAGGVVFLDEIGEIPLPTQAKLLRALETRTFRRVGGVTTLAMDCALLAATNRDLAQEVAAGRFREDLYFRLNVVPIELPPLRERKDDLPALVDFFLDRFNDQLGKEVSGVTEEAMDQLQRWDWPGNVRELRNVLERIVLLHADDCVRLEHLPREIRFARASDPMPRGCPFVLPDDGVDLEAVERGLLQQALDRTHGNQSAAARLLGISRYALRYRMEKYELQG